ncbi:HNH endonuclease [Bacillus sp. AFS077874]|uniref:HNH endonuclease n=1 Tax=Bacillus sp. AFS077874 TaxID=2033513 RepID=UPI00256FC11A|nr:HNH endonuclease [Bacillus sp. AFS077874]
MTIPKNINKEYIIMAIKKIEKEGVPERRESTRFNLLYEGKVYPPKYLISIANIFANGKEYSSLLFSGGEETNKFLKGLGFRIIENELEIDTKKNSNSKSLKSFSWEIISEDLAIKTLDKSAFLHHGTGIPRDIRGYFNVQQMEKGERKEIVLEYRENVYLAVIEMENRNTSRTRLFWKSDFSDVIKNRFPKVYMYFKDKEEGSEIDVPKLNFQKVRGESNKYIVELLSPIDNKVIVEDIESEEIEWDELRTDGKIITYYGKRYERDPINRKRAIEIHGLSCLACGFNFEEIYGDRGKDFIEVHHVKPLSTIGEEVSIDPMEDLVPVCSNCHRMIHRKKEKVLTIEELRVILSN